MLLTTALLALTPLPLTQTHCVGSDIFACQVEQTFRGPVVLDHAGYTISACGDWSGDGVDDVLVGGAYPWDVTDNNESPGRTYLYTTPGGSGCDASPPLRISGRVEMNGTDPQGELFGWSVAFIGDVDGDGTKDFAAGAPRSDWNSTGLEWDERGRVYVFLSSMYAASGSNCIAESANLIIEGERIGHRFGHAIAEVGDFDADGTDDFDWDGDGVPDLIIGAPGGEKINIALDPFPGRVYVISGADILTHAVDGSIQSPPVGCDVSLAGNLVRVLTDIPALAFWTGKTTTGDHILDRFGYSVAVAGQTTAPPATGPDYPDVVVGAPQFVSMSAAVPQNPWGPGYVRVLTGPNSGDFYEFEGSGDPLVPVTLGCFGYSVSGQIDRPTYQQIQDPPQANILFEPDGYDDILVGEPLFDDTGPGGSGNQQAGRALALRVAPGGTAVNTLIRHIGSGSDWRLGWHVQSLGRFNGPADPYDSWAMSAAGFGTGSRQDVCIDECLMPPVVVDSGAALCGRLFVVSGYNGRICWRVTGQGFRDSCGWDIARNGDLDGAGLPELVFSSPRWMDPSGASELGKVYVKHR